MSEPLERILLRHQGKVTDKWKAYLREYDHLLDSWRKRPVRILEIGIQNGGSLEVWAEYFPNAERLVGCDINPACSQLRYDDPRIQVVVGDANTDQIEAQIRSASPSFDIILDDGSHTSGDIIRSFGRYFSMLVPGGLYVAEDLHCSYWQSFEGGLFDPYSSISFFKLLADIINREHWGVGLGPVDLTQGIAARHTASITTALLESVGSVAFYNSLCAVSRRLVDDDGLGNRVVAGSVAVVEPVIRELGGSRPHALDQSTNPRSMQRRPSAELLDDARAEIEALRKDYAASQDALVLQCQEASSLAHDLEQARQREQAFKERERQREAATTTEREQRRALQDQIAQLQHSLDSIQRSTSWRLTAPVRAAVGSMKSTHRISERLSAVRQSQGGYGGALRYGLRRYGLLSGEPVSPTPTGGADYREWLQAQEEAAPITASGRPGPKISIVMPIYETRDDHLAAAIDSVLRQRYPNWELCIVDDGSTASHLATTCEALARKDARVRYSARPVNGGIVAASNDAIDLASGEFLCFLDHDDCLHPAALERLAASIAEHDDVDILYTDEDKLDEAGQRCEPFFKPDWSPHLALSQAYLGHLVCYRRSLLNAVGRLSQDTNGAQDYDLWLRASIQARRIVHLPEILYHWRIHEVSTAMRPDAKPYAHTGGLAAISRYVALKYPDTGIRMEEGDLPFCYRACFDLDTNDLVSIIIPTRDRVDLLKVCIDSIRGQSSWQKFEILIIDNGSIETETADYLAALTLGDPRVRTLRADIPFNWSTLNNIGAAEAQGNVLLFLNNDTRVESADWLQSLAGFAKLPDVATVGGLLLFPDGTIQHSGVVVGMGGWADHVFRLQAPQHRVGPFVSPVLTRDVLAVTGACTAIETRKFRQLGGFDEAFQICGSDVELGLRGYRADLYNVVCCEARLVHYESQTRTPQVPANDFEQSDLKYRPWRVDAVDPFYNPNLSLQSTNPLLREIKSDA